MSDRSEENINLKDNPGLLNDLSQEIRTPINSIMGLNELILRDSRKALENPEIGRAETMEILSSIKEYSRNIESAGNALLTLIKELLSLCGVEPERSEPEGPSDGNAASHNGNTHILIVDDTPMHLLVTKGLLKDTNVKIDTAESGGVAISMACRKQYDLILMDQRMPGMDGVTAMHYIRNDRNGLNRETPFICLTADAAGGAKERYISEGFADYLSKPIDGDELAETLARHLPADKRERINKGSGI